MADMFTIGPGRYQLGGAGPLAAAAPTTASGLTALPTPAAAVAGEGKPWHPSSPMFAFGVVAALTFGLMAVSTSGGVSVRVGKTVAGASGAAGIGK